jgi:hypothetical protein
MHRYPIWRDHVQKQESRYTLRKKGGGVLWQHKTSNHFDGNFHKVGFVGIGNVGPSIKFRRLLFKK